MRCASCGAKNPAGTKFCVRCGTQAAVAGTAEAPTTAAGDDTSPLEAPAPAVPAADAEEAPPPPPPPPPPPAVEPAAAAQPTEPEVPVTSDVPTPAPLAAVDQTIEQAADEPAEQAVEPVVEPVVEPLPEPAVEQPVPAGAVASVGAPPASAWAPPTAMPGVDAAPAWPAPEPAVAAAAEPSTVPAGGASSAPLDVAAGVSEVSAFGAGMAEVVAFTGRDHADGGTSSAGSPANGSAPVWTPPPGLTIATAPPPGGTGLEPAAVPAPNPPAAPAFASVEAPSAPAAAWGGADVDVPAGSTAEPSPAMPAAGPDWSSPGVGAPLWGDTPAPAPSLSVAPGEAPAVPVITELPPEEPAQPYGFDPHRLGEAVRTLSPNSLNAGRIAIGILSALLEGHEQVEVMVQGRYQSHLGVAVLTDQRVLLVNEQEWVPAVRSIPLRSDLLVQGWQDDHTASLIFVADGQSITISDIVDGALAQDLARRLRERVATLAA
jgi:hypothetical protein